MGGSYGRGTDASWNWTIGVNLMSVVWGIEIFGPLIEAHGEGGQIVSTASIAGLISRGAGPAYNVTKYGVVALSEGLRVTLAPRGICESTCKKDPVLECAPNGGHFAELELTRTAGLSEDESHGQTPLP